MYAPERQQSILARARAEGRVEVAALAEILRVTPETVRRDLTALERRGVVRRVHGGALPVERLELEPSLATRQVRLTAEKRRIAERAIAELPAEGTVLLDSGSTTQAVAELIPADSALTIVTNSIDTAAALHRHGRVEVFMLGGRVRSRTAAAVGSWVDRCLTDVIVDVAILGTNGYSELGMTTPDQAEAGAKRAMVRAARRVIVVADSTKAGQTHFHRFARPDEVALLVTDERLDDETCELLEAVGTDVVRA